MGTSTGVALSLRLSKDLPREVFDFIRIISNRKESVGDWSEEHAAIISQEFLAPVAQWVPPNIDWDVDSWHRLFGNQCDDEFERWVAKRFVVMPDYSYYLFCGGSGKGLSIDAKDFLEFMKPWIVSENDSPLGFYCVEGSQELHVMYKATKPVGGSDVVELMFENGWGDYSEEHDFDGDDKPIPPHPRYWRIGDMIRNWNPEMGSDFLLTQPKKYIAHHPAKEPTPVNKSVDVQYKELLNDIMSTGRDKSDRTGTGTRSVFGRQLRFNLQDGFPLLSLKRVPFKSLVAELLWFLKGSTDNKLLNEMGSTIWDEWAITERTIVEHYLGRSDSGCLDLISSIMSSNDRSVFQPLNDSEWVPPEGWIRVETTHNGVKAVEYMHPQYWAMVLDDMIAESLIPESARERIGDLGPIYGKQWRRWEVIDTVEDMSLDALLNRRVAYLRRKDPAMGSTGYIYQSGTNRLLGLLRTKPYAAEMPYYFEALPETNPAIVAQTEAGMELYSQEQNVEALYRDLLNDLMQGVMDAPILKFVTREVDQVQYVIDILKTKPNSRRILVSAWNVADLSDESKTPHQNAMDDKMALTPCHTFFQFIAEDMTTHERLQVLQDKILLNDFTVTGPTETMEQHLDDQKIPTRRLSCQVYIRKQYCGLAA